MNELPPGRADTQRLTDLQKASKPASTGDLDATESTSPTSVTTVSDPAAVSNDQKTRFFGSVTIDSQLYGRDFTNLSREVLDRLADSDVELEITVEIQAKKRSGFDANVRRTVAENARALNFDESAFEAE